MRGLSRWGTVQRMRFIHTSDWHLGHRLHGRRRDEEHDAFLEWLLDQVEAQSADAVVIAGDVFDTANPPASALGLWYRFLASARSRFPGLDIVVVAGNHDSAARIDAPRPVLLEAVLLRRVQRGGLRLIQGGH